MHDCPNTTEIFMVANRAPAAQAPDREPQIKSHDVSENSSGDDGDTPKRPYDLHAYRHLNESDIVTLDPSTRILHVTKEFGPATMGGMGVMLTALSIAQSESPLLSISVTLPHYSYFKDLALDIIPFANLSIPFATHASRQKVKQIHCPVSLLRWSYTPAQDFLEPGAPTKPVQRSIDVYLIGPSEDKPFSAAFRAKDEGDIYSAYKPLKGEWKESYFVSAVAELVAHLAAGGPAAARAGAARRPFDVVHLHGATNAMVAHYVRERIAAGPAVVYSLHDTLDELEYANLAVNLRRFLLPPRSASAGDVLASLEPYLYRDGAQLFTSALGIDLADMTTFVSRSIAEDIVTGRFRFHLENLVMPSIAARAGKGEFIGVTNGLDFTERSRNPFTNDQLVDGGLAFPRIGSELLRPSTFGPSTSFVAAKARARAHLVRHLPQLFSPEDEDRPWFLFIGRYQYNKGCQFVATLLEVLSSPPVDGRLILVGARNNFPFDSLQRLARQYPRHMTLIDDRTPSTSGIQAAWGPVLRMASDVAFVPSLSEAFGLVAAEALLFGMPVLSTGVGGLREFLVSFPISDEDASATVAPDERRAPNAYLFDLFPRAPSLGKSLAQGAEADYSRAAHDVRPDEAQLLPAREELRRAALRAVRDWRARSEGSEIERERFVRRLVMDALSLRWDREDGPIDEYIRVYDRAIKNRDRRIEAARRFEPERRP
ncbi:hypothetical protein Rhopal_000471-T1 [Rhodotorula paludigena]|uniref:Alpha-1,3-glucan synthase n=1 Tax=Rhodotorula paludigena TaxID=86838 RepID=A0AAV5GCQ4_9BASI|nr:hypothetical protein Rhopal_000471-T1 [Rhodotorula paludigena]